MKKKYIYYVSYFVNNGVGGSEFTINHKINSIEDIRSIEKAVLENDSKEVFVTVINCMLLREE